MAAKDFNKSLMIAVCLSIYILYVSDKPIFTAADDCELVKVEANGTTTIKTGNLTEVGPCSTQVLRNKTADERCNIRCARTNRRLKITAAKTKDGKSGKCIKRLSAGVVIGTGSPFEFRFGNVSRCACCRVV